jgi:hypothetical protein
MTAVDAPDVAQTARPAPPRCRPFRLADAMVLTAAAAVVCLYLEAVIVPLMGHIPGMVHRLGLWRAITADPQAFVMLPFGVVVVTLICLTPAYIIIRLLPPRPPLREVAGQPGVVAVGVVLLDSIVGLRESWFTMAFTLLAVPVAWSVVVARGRWRTESGWIDAFGKAVGFGWLMLP